MLSKKFAVPNRNTCVACGACRLECPRNAIQIVSGCYAKVDEAICIGCGICSKICPASSITLKERGE